MSLLLMWFGKNQQIKPHTLEQLLGFVKYTLSIKI